MAIFKKQSPLEGNPCKPDGNMLEFTGLYYETDDESDIAFLKGFKCYSMVDSKEEVQVQPPKQAKAMTGVISAAGLAGLAAQNK